MAFLYVAIYAVLVYVNVKIMIQNHKREFTFPIRNEDLVFFWCISILGTWCLLPIFLCSRLVDYTGLGKKYRVWLKEPAKCNEK